MKRRRRELIPGGKAPGGRCPVDVSQATIARGIKVELEHTSSRRVAREIACDHLWEDRDYYTKLARVHLDGARRRCFSLAGTGSLRWKKVRAGVYRAESPWGVYVIDGNNYGRNRWTVTYPDGDYGMADALIEAKAWAETNAASRKR